MEIKISDSSFCILFFRKCHYPFLSLYPQILKNGLYEKNGFETGVRAHRVVGHCTFGCHVCCGMHCTDPFNFYPGTSPEIGEIKFWGAAYGAVLRPCVPLFVMITGALLLPVRESSGTFYKKRIMRVFSHFSSGRCSTIFFRG